MDALRQFQQVLSLPGAPAEDTHPTTRDAARSAATAVRLPASGRNAEAHLLMQLQAERIERFFWTHGIGVRVTGGVKSARLMTFELDKDPRARYAALERLADDLALALGVRDVRVERTAHAVLVQVPLPDFRPVAAGNLPSLPRPGPVALLGQDAFGKPAWLDLASPNTAHLLVVAATGAGKTELLRTMAWSLVRDKALGEVSLLLIDPKNNAFADWYDVAHLAHPVIADLQEAVAALRWAVALMERRERQGCSRPELAIFVDELLDLVLVAGDEFGILLQRLATRGRGAGVHLVAATQHATATVLGNSIIKAQMTARIVGRVMSASDSNLATGVAGLECHKLLGEGDFLAVTAGRVTRFQAALTGAGEMASLRHTGRAAPVAAITEATPLGATGGGITDAHIRHAWESGNYTSRRALEMELFGYAGGQAALRVQRALAERFRIISS